jgi:hypothetical protein
LTLYFCNYCGNTRELSKTTIVVVDQKVVVAEALCHCGYYMDSEPTEGMPNLKRTEASLSKKKRGDKLWEGAKEKLTGERGVNDSFD